MSIPLHSVCMFNTNTSCVTAPNPLCTLVRKKSYQYCLKHRRSAFCVCKTYSFQYGLWLPVKSSYIGTDGKKKMHIYECSNYTYGVEFTSHSHLNHLADAFTQSDSEKVHQRSTDGEHVIWNEVLPVWIQTSATSTINLIHIT